MEHPYAQRLRELNKQSDFSYRTMQKGVENSDPAICANVNIGLIKVTMFLLDLQVKKLESEFLKEGGLRERMTKARLAVRNRKN